MELVNGSKHIAADVTTGIDTAGREHLIIVAKVTYAIPENGKMARPLATPQPVAASDIFVANPEDSAPLYDCDFLVHKPKCDVLFNAHAHAPNGRPVKQLNVKAEVGSMFKAIRVVGNRHWIAGFTKAGQSEPEPFTRMPLHYGHAFGGGLIHHRLGVEMYDILPTNPVGRGYRERATMEELHKSPLPNLEAIGKPITSPSHTYAPQALSALGRHWLPRRKYVGTYDDNWLKNIFPFMPEDFDDRYLQSAPVDQQIDYPKGGETVRLINMMAGREMVEFKLPRLTNMPIKVLTKHYEVFNPEPVVDTLYFEPDALRNPKNPDGPRGQFTVVWRATVPIKRSMREFTTITVGTVCKNWWDAKRMGLPSCGGCNKKQSTEEAPADCPETTSTEGAKA